MFRKVDQKVALLSFNGEVEERLPSLIPCIPFPLPRGRGYNNSVLIENDRREEQLWLLLLLARTESI